MSDDRITSLDEWADGFDPTTAPGFDPASVDWDQYEDEQPWPDDGLEWDTTSHSYEYIGKHRA